MADEITLSWHLQVLKDNLDYGPVAETFQADMTNGKGPSPGFIAVSTAGTTIDLSQLTLPAVCRIKNLDTANFVEYGPYSGGTFYPLGELLAGESYPIRLSRNIAALRLRANSSSCDCIIECFDA